MAHAIPPTQNKWRRLNAAGPKHHGLGQLIKDLLLRSEKEAAAAECRFEFLR
jgi:hypothetical protein